MRKPLTVQCVSVHLFATIIEFSSSVVERHDAEGDNLIMSVCALHLLTGKHKQQFGHVFVLIVQHLTGALSHRYRYNFVDFFANAWRLRT